MAAPRSPSTNPSSKAPVLLALAAALGYSISTPSSKLLLGVLPPIFMASLMYLGGALGTGGIRLLDRDKKLFRAEAPLVRADMPWMAAIVALDIIAPIAYMYGLGLTTSATASLLHNFEVVGTALIALFVFREAIGLRLWVAIVLITAASIILSVTDITSLSFSLGSLLTLLAGVCWSLENNISRKLAHKDPMQITFIKGLGAGTAIALIALLAGEKIEHPLAVLPALLIGMIAYGIATYCFIKSQRGLGAARTSAYTALSPFLAVIYAFILFDDPVNPQFLVALALMAVGVYLAISEQHVHEHTHELMTHEHRHRHDDGHHNHAHTPPVPGAHYHEHTHEPLVHSHPHTPDLHHRHAHSR